MRDFKVLAKVKQMHIFGRKLELARYTTTLNLL